MNSVSVMTRNGLDVRILHPHSQVPKAFVGRWRARFFPRLLAPGNIDGRRVVCIAIVLIMCTRAHVHSRCPLGRTVAHRSKSRCKERESGGGNANEFWGSLSPRYFGHSMLSTLNATLPTLAVLQRGESGHRPLVATFALLERGAQRRPAPHAVTPFEPRARPVPVTHIWRGQHASCGAQALLESSAVGGPERIMRERGALS